MLYERIEVLTTYVQAVSQGKPDRKVSTDLEGKAKPDHNILRQISALIAGLPTMDAVVFRSELEDVGGILIWSPVHN